jgi:hypothetical protein
MKSTNHTVRLPGLLWFLSAVFGGFGLFYIRSNIIIPGDATATAANIMSSQFLYRTAIVSTLFSQVFLFLFGIALFYLFKEVNRMLATVLLTAVMMTVGIAVVNTLNHFAALLLLSQAEYLKVFSPEQLNAMAMLFLRLANSFGQGLLEIFWTPYFFAFGLLIIRSRFAPKILGILLIVASVGYGINVFTKFLIPQFHPVTFTRSAMALGALGVLPTLLWFLIIGAQISKQSVPEA